MIHLYGRKGKRLKASYSKFFKQRSYMCLFLSLRILRTYVQILNHQA